MFTIFEILRGSQLEVLAELERRWGFKHTPAPLDREDSEFRYYDKLMRKVPRGR